MSYSETEIIEKYSLFQKFEFIQNLASEPSMLSPEVIHDELARLLISHPKQHDEIVEWIEVLILQSNVISLTAVLLSANGRM